MVERGHMKLGYARVSTSEQNLERQIDRLSAAGCEMLFEEKISGAARHRPEFEKLLGQLRRDDVLVVTRLDRLARSTAELLRIAEKIGNKHAHLQSLDEPWADTGSPAGKMIMTVFGGIAEFERSLILSRTHDGRIATKRRGVAFGRPKSSYLTRKRSPANLSTKASQSARSPGRSTFMPQPFIAASTKHLPYDGFLFHSAAQAKPAAAVWQRRSSRCPPKICLGRRQTEGLALADESAEARSHAGARIRIGLYRWQGSWRSLRPRQLRCGRRRR